MDKIELAQKILDFRARKNISMGEMAKRCNVSTQTIYSIENGLQQPTRVTERKILNVIEGEN